jgi:hypothetical protein
MHDELWQGQVQSFDLDSDASADEARRLRLALETPTALQLGMGTVRTRNLCLRGGEVRLCLDAERAASSAWSAGFSATSLPLHALTAGLSQEITYDGTLNLEVKAAGEKDHRTTGEIHAELRDALLRHAVSNNREERFALGTGAWMPWPRWMASMPGSISTPAPPGTYAASWSASDLPATGRTTPSAAR